MDGSSKDLIYEFGPFRADAHGRQLLRGRLPIRVSAKAFDVLLILLGSAGETVSREQLIDTIWNDAVVEDNNLTQAISGLRKALGERDREHSFIATVPGRGYCFVGNVRETPRAAIGSAQRRLGLFGIDGARMRGSALAAIYVAVVCIPVVLSVIGVGTGHPQSLAVLQFRSNSGDEFIGTGISDTLRARLGSVDDLVVRPRTPMTESGDVIATGRHLDVDAVVTGSVQRVEGRVRVTVEVVDVSNGRLVWGETFDDELADVFMLQDSIADRVASALRMKLRAAIRHVSFETSTV
jgi:DNA-binding winged helix-turn-helix (wHTH) protein/TolB-like protein